MNATFVLPVLLGLFGLVWADLIEEYEDLITSPSYEYEDNLLSGIKWGHKLDQSHSDPKKIEYAGRSEISRSSTTAQPSTTTRKRTKIKRGRKRTTKQPNHVKTLSRLKNHRLSSNWPDLYNMFPDVVDEAKIERSEDDFTPSIQMPPIFIPSPEIPLNPDSNILNEKAITYDTPEPTTSTESIHWAFPPSLNSIVSPTDGGDIFGLKIDQQHPFIASIIEPGSNKRGKNTLKPTLSSTKAARRPPTDQTKALKPPQRPVRLSPTRPQSSKPPSPRPPRPKPPKRPTPTGRLQKVVRKKQKGVFSRFYAKVRNRMARLKKQSKLRLKKFGKKKKKRRRLQQNIQTAHKKRPLRPPQLIKPKDGAALSATKRMVRGLNRVALQASEIMMYMALLNG